jgi:LPS-assembly protein
MSAPRPASFRWLSSLALLSSAPVLRAADQPLPQAPLPITLQADRLLSTTDRETIAEGAVELRQGGLLIRADRLSYRPPTDRANARGNVFLQREGATYRGSEVDLAVKDFSGWFVDPSFDFPLLGTRGQASRIDFASRTRFTAAEARYTSCPRPDDGSEPDWQLQARKVTLDFDANEGLAEGARLRFQGVSILALPRMSFPITGERKSGWLPPTLNLDSRSGFELSVPYYWNIAPDRDLTLAPRLITRRGLGVESEYRYLAPRYSGQLSADLLPDDRLAGRTRHALNLLHRHTLPRGGSLLLEGLRVSDNAWWKDFQTPDNVLTPRLLGSQARWEQPLAWQGLALDAYAQVQHWQVLQDLEAAITAPYARRPQLGLAGQGSAGPLELNFETELNRFERPDDDAAGSRPEGWRWHAVGTLGWPLRQGGLAIVPRLTLNAASYRTDQPMADGRRSAQRLVPTLSLDASLAFERETDLWFGRTLRQTLEPRLLWVRTPYRRQDQLPNFDAWGKDFNLSSIYTPNAFSGVDRVSDAHELTAGATSRLVDPLDGSELLRVGVVQRFLFRDQLVAPQADGQVDGAPLEQRFSDVLLLGSTKLIPQWSLDASLQYSPDVGRLSRSILGASYTPGPFRTVSGRYRLARGVSEQFELGWQWPLYKAEAPAGGGSGCRGTWYSVGRMNYSLRDSRVTDSLLGAEYDAGCWILRVVSERLSTGRSEATTRLLLQLELVGLSRLGSNPLQVLKDNIPGYRLLREDRDERAVPTPP